MSSVKEKSRANRHRIGIKWKLYGIIVGFIVCVLLSIWIFQVRMLNVFYQNAKFYELEESSNDIFAALDNESEAMNVALSYSERYYFDIWVLEIKGPQGEWVAQINGSGNSILPFISHKMEALYSMTVQNSGKYIATVPADSFAEDFAIRALEDNSGHPNSFPKVTRYNGVIGTLYSRIDTVGSKTYMVVQYAMLTPLQTTVSTLEHQFIFIGITMIVMALLLAAVLSKFITRPFVKMNAAAKKLAQGNYGEDFSGRGYREVEELSETLSFASSELARSDLLKKELISNVSHDLRTPLTLIKGYGEIIRDIPEENTPENIQVIIDETARLSDLVNDMLDLSKIQSGTRKPMPEELSITQTIRHTLTRYSKLIMQEAYDISFDFDTDAVIMADRVMILQVVYNLINNAINYTGEDKRVQVVQKTTDTRVRISVIDTGEGIDAEDIDAIWDRYYRVDKVHKRATIGTGLGLSIVKEILEAHGAEFGVCSTKGKGSTFWFELGLLHTPEILDAEYDNSEQI